MRHIQTSVELKAAAAAGEVAISFTSTELAFLASMLAYRDVDASPHDVVTLANLRAAFGDKADGMLGLQKRPPSWRP